MNCSRSKKQQWHGCALDLSIYQRLDREINLFFCSRSLPSVIELIELIKYTIELKKREVKESKLK